MKRQNAVVIGILSLLLVLSARLPVNAIGFTWVAGDGDWHVPQFWAPYAPPVMGPPALGDAALITGDRNVTLSADALGLAGMVLQAQADVFTDGHQLTVVNLNGTAQTTVVGTGDSGNNTELFVEVVGGTTPGFIGDLVNLSNGGELDLTGGAIAHVTNELDVDSLSKITGHGTIVFTDTHNVQGVRLNMRGTIEPDTNDTIRLVAESGTINLDGQGPAGPRLIDLTNSGATLEVVGELSDAFSGRIEMRPNTTLSISEPWSIGMGDTVIPVLNFVGGTGQATITGAEVTIGSGTADIDVVSGDLMIEANSRWQSAANIFVGANAELNIFGDNAIITGGSWTGTGTVNLNAQLTTIAADTDINMPGGTFDLDGHFTNETLAVNQTLRLFVGSVDDEGNSIDDRVQINGAAGQLEVHLTDPSATYGFAGDLELNGPGGGLTGVHLVGSGARLTGTTSVSGNSIVQAPLEFLSDVIFANGATLTLQGGSADDPNVVRSFATFAGSGELRVSSGAQLNVQDGLSTGLQVVNNGRFEPGLSLGTVNMRSFTQDSSGTLAMEIEGPPEVGQDRIVTTQSSHVDGDLEVTVSNGFIPNLASVYTLLSADFLTGTFDDLILLSDSIFDYQATLTYPGARVVLQFTDVSMQGDFSDDFALTCADVDALVAEIASGGADLIFDMTGDGLVNAGDLDEWLDVAGTFNVGAPYLGGDANLDGLVDGADFLIWNANKFTNTPAWCQGDFTADGFIDGQDFLIWNANKFSESDLAATVPEPASQLLLLLCIALTVRNPQRRDGR